MQPTILTPTDAVQQLKRKGLIFCDLLQGDTVTVASIDPQKRTFIVEGNVIKYEKMNGLFYTYNLIVPKKIGKHKPKPKPKHKKPTYHHLAK